MAFALGMDGNERTPSTSNTPAASIWVSNQGSERSFTMEFYFEVLPNVAPNFAAILSDISCFDEICFQMRFHESVALLPKQSTFLSLGTSLQATFVALLRRPD